MKILWLINEGNATAITQSDLFDVNKHQYICKNSDYINAKNLKFREYNALVVQINLGWYDKDNTYDGISLVQHIRQYQLFDKPIVFLSPAISRESLLKNHPELAIVSTFGLGNGFCHLSNRQPRYTLPVDIDNEPYSLEEYISLMPSVDDARKKHIEYFCTKEGQIRGVRHDIKSISIEQTKSRLKKLFADDRRIDEAATQTALYDLCNTLEQEIKDNKPTTVAETSDNERIKVVLLDDNHPNDKGLNYFLKYSQNALDIHCCKTVAEALTAVHQLNPKVVLVDLRLQSDNDFPVLNKQQGYDYINIHKKDYPHIGFIVLSELPMKFLKDLSRSMNHFRTFYWKKELEGTTYYDILIQSITELATTRFKNDTPQKNEFEKLYNWWYGIDTSEGLSDVIISDSATSRTYEQFVDDESEKIIKSISEEGVFVALKKSGRVKLSNPHFEELTIQCGWKKDATLSKLFILRRVAIYLSYYLYENITTNEVIGKAFAEVKNYNKNSDSRYDTAIKRYTAEVVNRILANNWNTNKNGITNKFLFFKGKAGNRIYSYKDISLTKEEKEFFARYFSDFFNAWNQMR